MTTELRMYSTVAGELPSLVRNQTPKCFVEYEQYLELKAEYEKELNRADKYQNLFDATGWPE